MRASSSRRGTMRQVISLLKLWTSITSAAEDEKDGLIVFVFDFKHLSCARYMLDLSERRSSGAKPMVFYSSNSIKRIITVVCHVPCSSYLSSNPLPVVASSVGSSVSSATRTRRPLIGRGPPLVPPPPFPLPQIPLRHVPLPINVRVAARPPLNLGPAPVGSISSASGVPIVVHITLRLAVRSATVTVSLLPIPIPLIPSPSPTTGIVVSRVQVRRMLRIDIRVTTVGPRGLKVPAPARTHMIRVIRVVPRVVARSLGCYPVGENTADFLRQLLAQGASPRARDFLSPPVLWSQLRPVGSTGCRRRDWRWRRGCPTDGRRRWRRVPMRSALGFRWRRILPILGTTRVLRVSSWLAVTTWLSRSLGERFGLWRIAVVTLLRRWR